MYRKVLVLFLSSIFDIPVLVKVTALLFLNTFFYYVTMITRPFQISDLNELEKKSNISALCIGYFGLLYLAIDNEFSKGLIFVFLLYVNLKFLLFWIRSILQIIVASKAEALHRLCPNFISRCLEISESKRNFWLLFPYSLYHKIYI